MRYALVVLSLLTAGCSAAPGSPLTDVTAVSTEATGPYEVVQRSLEGKRYALQVDAMRPDRGKVIAERLLYQLLPYSPEEVVVEVRPHKSVSGQTTRVRWQRGKDVSASTITQPDLGTAAGDRIGNRPTGQSGTETDH